MSTQTAVRTMDGFTLEDIVKAVAAVLQPDLQPEPAHEEPHGLVSDVAVKTYKAFEDYPDILKAKHVRAILGVSEAKAYEILGLFTQTYPKTLLEVPQTTRQL